MTAWFFGDSYSIPLDSVAGNIDVESGGAIRRPAYGKLWKYQDNWISLVCKGLKEKSANIVAQYGVSNDYVFKHFADHYPHILDGDYVVIQLTSSNRKWFFPDEPALSNIVQSVGYTPERRGAIEQYLMHLQNDQLDNIQFTAYIYAIQLMIMSRPNISFLLLPGHDEVPGVIGNLTRHVCNPEIKGNPKFFYDYHNNFDPRLNHMSPGNHQVLATKILEFFKDGTTVDLTEGFYKDLYTPDEE